MSVLASFRGPNPFRQLTAKSSSWCLLQPILIKYAQVKPDHFDGDQGKHSNKTQPIDDLMHCHYVFVCFVGD